MTIVNRRREYDDAPRIRQDDVALEARPTEARQRDRRSYLARFAAGATAPVADRFDLIVL